MLLFLEPYIYMQLELYHKYSLLNLRSYLGFIFFGMNFVPIMYQIGTLHDTNVTKQVNGFWSFTLCVILYLDVIKAQNINDNNYYYQYLLVWKEHKFEYLVTTLYLVTKATIFFFLSVEGPQVTKATTSSMNIIYFWICQYLIS